VIAAHRDDHLRNHGFLRATNGWRLAPAFDLNPLPDKAEHTIAFDDQVRTPDLALARETARYYRLTDRRAEAVEDEVRAAVLRCRERARSLAIPRDEIDLMGAALDA